MTALDRALSARLGPDWRPRLARWCGAAAVLGAIAALAADPVIRTAKVSGRLESEIYAQEDDGHHRAWTVRLGTDELRRVTPRAGWTFESGAEICILLGRTALLGIVRTWPVNLGPCAAKGEGQA